MYTTFVKYINILFPVSNKNYRMHFVNSLYNLCRLLANNKS